MTSSEDFLNLIYEFSLHKKLPSQKELASSVRRCVSVLQNEDEVYRARTTQGEKICGGLVDFCGLEKKPCIVVPDIHARPEFIYDILQFVLEKEESGFEKDMRVFEALDAGLLRLVLAGDILHAEARAYRRWKAAYKEYLDGFSFGRSMREEMCEGLCALMAVMECKCRWPENFHCLKGNHENIKNETGGGNYGFMKFVDEGEMVFRFMLDSYGFELLENISVFEKSLPIMFCTENLIVSHAEPLTALDRDSVINAPYFDSVTLALTWTANDEAEEGSVAKMLADFCSAKNPVYIGGHRPVEGKYKLRQNGLYVQIHNPEERNIALVRPDGIFDPERDIFSVSP